MELRGDLIRALAHAQFLAEDRAAGVISPCVISNHVGEDSHNWQAFHHR